MAAPGGSSGSKTHGPERFSGSWEGRTAMNELAGGFFRGDRVLCHGRPGMIYGKPARAACNRISVSVMYEDGSVKDERVANIQLLDDLEPAAEVQDEEPSMEEPGPAEPLEATAPRPSLFEEPPAPEPDLDETVLQPQLPVETVPARASRPVIPKIAGIGRRAPEPLEALAPEPPDDEPDLGATLEAPKQLFASAEPRADKVEVDGMADMVLEKIRKNFANLRMAFRALDRSNNGYISRADFLDALEHIFLNAGHTPEEVDEIAERFSLGGDSSDTLSYEEFCEIVGTAEADPYAETMESAEVQKEDRSSRERIESVQLGLNSFRQICDRRYASMRESFRALDRSRKSALSPQEFAHGLSMHGVNFQPQELQDAWDIFDPSGKGIISYADFCRVMSQKVQFGRHLNRQMYK
mmetsp:Transcript_25693/g.58262  ORF Transcript_25693/g.58262 Transcript_25693/m.58262 type:complete len:411 (-) Transcript_25693:127-1359(-)